MLTSGSIENVRAEVLERGGELRRIRSLIDRAAGGVGAVLCVEGEAGIGKTAMLQETRAMAERAGLAVLSARGGELERDFAHGVARQLYEPELRHAPAGRAS
jgi:predicted ATP-dependent serine protease